MHANRWRAQAVSCVQVSPFAAKILLFHCQENFRRTPPPNLEILDQKIDGLDCNAKQFYVETYRNTLFFFLQRRHKTYRGLRSSPSGGLSFRVESTDFTAGTQILHDFTDFMDSA